MGDEVLSCYGSGDFRPARVTDAFASERDRAASRSSRAAAARSSAPPEHMHFAGYRLGISPQLHMTYLMCKSGAGLPGRDDAHLHRRGQASR